MRDVVQETTTTVASGAARIVASTGRDWFDYLQFAIVALGAALAAWVVYLMVVQMWRSKTSIHMEYYASAAKGSPPQIHVQVNMTATTPNALLKVARIRVWDQGKLVLDDQPSWERVYTGERHRVFQADVPDTGSDEIKIQALIKFSDKARVRKKKKVAVDRRS